MSHHSASRRLRFPGWLSQLALAGLCLLTGGCGRGPTLAEPDRSAIEALLRYNLTYELDNYGQVIVLKMHHQDLNAAALREVGKLSELRRLSLYGCTLADEDLVELAGLKHLQNLGLGSTSVTDRGLAYLESLRMLRRVWLPRQDSISDERIAALKKALPGLAVFRQQ